MPKKRTSPRIFLHHWLLLCGVKGNEGLGLAGFCVRLRVDCRMDMATLLMTAGLGEPGNGSESALRMSSRLSLLFSLSW
jgi:hypothetical protein